MKILAGPNEGRLWSVASRKAFLTGAFERSRVEAIQRLAMGVEQAWDVGASLGYISLVLADCVGPEGRVTAVEPNRSNLWYLRHHLAWNHITNCSVLAAAITEEPGETRFNPRSSGTGYVARDETTGTYAVPATTFDEMIESSGAEPGFVKIDIDLNYVDCFAQADKLLGYENLIMLVATNCSESIHAKCKRRFEGYDLEVIEPRRCTQGSFHGIESEILVLGPRAKRDAEAIQSFVES